MWIINFPVDSNCFVVLQTRCQKWNEEKKHIVSIELTKMTLNVSLWWRAFAIWSFVLHTHTQPHVRDEHSNDWNSCCLAPNNNNVHDFRVQNKKLINCLFSSSPHDCFWDENLIKFFFVFCLFCRRSVDWTFVNQLDYEISQTHIARQIFSAFFVAWDSNQSCRAHLIVHSCLYWHYRFVGCLFGWFVMKVWFLRCQRIETSKARCIIDYGNKSL